MIKEFSDLWNIHNKKLLERLRHYNILDIADYEKLLKIMFEVFDYEYYDLHTIDDGSWSGTLVFVFTNSDYEPYINNYLFTYIDYGSCQVCDSLQRALSNSYIDYTALLDICLTMLQNINYFTKGRD